MNYINNTLSICIPTYNRCEILKENLNNLIEILSPYGILINISDNASEDNTKEVVELAKKRYPNINYSRNETNIGFDRNCEKVLKMNTARYAWLMSDNDSLTSRTKEVIELLEAGNYNLVLVGFDKKIETKLYTNRNDVLADLAGTMSWIGALIISKEVIEIANFSRFYDTAFVHTGTLLEALTNIQDVRVLYLSDAVHKYFYEIVPGLCLYSDAAFSAFSGMWISLILSLPPAYPFHVKKKGVWSLQSAPFIITALMGYRSEGMYDYRRLKNDKDILRCVISNKYYAMMFCIAICPKSVLMVIRKIKHFLLKRTK